MSNENQPFPPDMRDGETAATQDPATMPADAHLVFIGRIRSPWKQRSECPRNMRRAREQKAEGCLLEIDEAWREGLTGIKAGDHVHILYWMHQSRRDLVLQRPRHRETATGVFSLRSPVRPNPIALALVKILNVDATSGRLIIDGTDALDKTALLDIKPHMPTVDAAEKTPQP